MRCQWIEAEIDPLQAEDLDAIKCNRPTRDRDCPYCEEHLARAFATPGQRAAEKREWAADPRNPAA